MARRVAALPLLALALLPAVGQGQPGAREPVPASAFKGRTMVDPTLGFSIDSPGPGWTWTRSENAAVKLVQFQCTSPEETDRFTVAVLQPEAPRKLDQAEADGYLSGVAQAAENRGWRVSGQGCTRWAGVADGWRCAFSAESAQKEKAHHVHYIVSTGRFYSIQNPHLGGEESPLFKQFAASFRLLQ